MLFCVFTLTSLDARRFHTMLRKVGRADHLAVQASSNNLTNVTERELLRAANDSRKLLLVLCRKAPPDQYCYDL